MTAPVKPVATFPAPSRAVTTQPGTIRAPATPPALCCAKESCVAVPAETTNVLDTASVSPAAV